MNDYNSSKKKVKFKAPRAFQSLIDTTSSLLRVKPNGDVIISRKVSKRARKTCTHIFVPTGMGAGKDPKNLLMPCDTAAHPELAGSYTCGICNKTLTPRKFSEIVADLRKVRDNNEYLRFILQWFNLSDKDATVFLDYCRGTKRMIKLMTALCDAENSGNRDSSIARDYSNAIAGRVRKYN